MSKAPKDQRIKLYKDRKVQLLISKFLSGDITKLIPLYDMEKGYGYPVVDALLGDYSSTDEYLQKLLEAGVLKRELYDKIVYCPFCDKANVSMHYCCPHCRSFDVEKSALIEHIKCGYIATEEHFRQQNKLSCPRCQKEMVKPDTDYHKAGVWCACNQCGENFDIPVPVHFCRDCSRTFTFEEAVCKNAYAYSLAAEAEREATTGWIMIVPIRQLLERQGFEVASPGFLKGKSGTRHMFDVTASTGGEKSNLTVIDLATATDNVVSEQSILAMFAKIYDTSPDKACLVAIPKISENGMKLANLYEIEVIAGKDQKDVLKALTSCIKKASRKNRP